MLVVKYTENDRIIKAYDDTYKSQDNDMNTNLLI